MTKMEIFEKEEQQRLAVKEFLAKQTKSKRKFSFNLFNLFSKAVLLIWCGFTIFAFLWIFISSLKTNNEFFASVWGFFKAPQFGNYITVWNDYSLGINFLNKCICRGNIGSRHLGMFSSSSLCAFQG